MSSKKHTQNCNWYNFALVCWPSVAIVTSQKDFSSRRCLKEATMLVWKSFHRRQNCWSSPDMMNQNFGKICNKANSINQQNSFKIYKISLPQIERLPNGFTRINKNNYQFNQNIGRMVKFSTLKRWQENEPKIKFWHCLRVNPRKMMDWIRVIRVQ